MDMHFIRRHIPILASGLALSAVSPWVAADPPSRVGRLGYLSGAVSFSPAGDNDWVQASLNRPLVTGDRLWTDGAADARAEIQIGGAAMRMDAGSSLTVLNLDDDIAQVLLSQGSLHVRVRRLGARQSFEVATPNLAFTLRQPGEYRIDVDAQRDVTTIVVHQGQGEAWGEDAAYQIDDRHAWRFAGSGLNDVEQIGAPRRNGFDRWAAERDRRVDNSRSARYVSADVVGYQDLDAYGSWRADAGYGHVWVPDRVADDWAPYSDGHWAWIDPWGWTWIDDAPWGFAVSHYGRWAHLRGTWAWVPGPVRAQAYYAPALVAFVGGDHFQLSLASGLVGAVAWFPLAPREVYRPSYPVSRRYFENVNRSNTVVNNTVIVNQYNTTQVSNVVYANRQVAGAVVAVPRTAFVQAQPVSRGRQRVSREVLAGQPVAPVAAVLPTEHSVRGSAAKGVAPPARAFERRAVARSAVPPAHPGLAAHRERLAEKPGRPLDTASRRQLKRDEPLPAPLVKVLAPREAAKTLPSPPPGRPPATALPPPSVAPVPAAQPAMVPVTLPPAQPGERAGANSRREATAVVPAPAAPVPAATRRGTERVPGGARDDGAPSRRDPPPIRPDAPLPAGLPAEPSGKPEAVPKPERDRKEQPAFPVRGDAAPAGTLAGPGGAEAAPGRAPVARSAPPAPVAAALPAPPIGPERVEPPPVPRAAADAGPAGGKEKMRSREGGDKQGSREASRERSRERREERRQEESAARAGQR